MGFRSLAVAATAAVMLLAAPFAGAQLKDEYTVSTVLPTPFPWGEAAERWAELVAERSDGRINLKIYPNAELVAGNQTREFPALRSGVIDFAIGSTINWSPQVPELNLFSLPFLMPDYAAIDALTQGEAGERIFEAVRGKGVVPLAWGENGFRELSNSSHVIRTPADLEGLKIRVVGSPLFEDTFTALGANPTQMSWADAKPALSTGAVDGQENPLSVFQIANIHEVGQKYLTRWHYMADPLIFAANRNIWQSFSEADRELIRQAAIDAGEWEIERSRAQVPERLEAIREQGVTITELSDEELAAFREATAEVYEEWTPRIGEALVELAREAIAERATE
ncbi:DctP family TRAP transporter solute-binding subunit [Sediminicurvatus halobius]|uniref:C4-dicarboxylate ABC transporter n=1 Tax=Sediminicurvatus halobius TaxID=2182432 RepID=A0A2U2N696_9GAMM|nr:DctP family TRAP transporter solute-binding subunit [Spiribacter halobius]PWG64587.1 C4-dicarboxylate ABC transporter [Spiribacter halobius]UEX79092.1 DctP family TRAP transporter solute-binding subunit [Spiribacter halobius]